MAAQTLICTVESVTHITPTVFRFRFKPDKPFDFIPGQFVSILIPGAGPGGRDLRRAYSIASSPESPLIELCIKLVEKGAGSPYLYGLKPGQTFQANAPFGNFIIRTGPTKHICMIATGTGVSPFRSIVNSKHYLSNPAKSVMGIFGVRTDDEVLYQSEFEKNSILKWIPCVSKPGPNWKGFVGRVTDYLKILPGDFPWLLTEFYLCGNGAMIDEVKKFLIEKGLPKEAIHQEVYYKPK